MRIEQSRVFIWAFSFAIVSTIIYWLENFGNQELSWIINLTYLFVIIAIWSWKDGIVDYFFLFYPFVLHEYGPDPYSDTFRGAFHGPIKYVILFLFGLRYLKINLNKKLLGILVLMLFSTLLELWDRQLNEIFEDLIIVSPFLLFFMNIRSNIRKNIPLVLFYYSIMLPITYFIIELIGMSFKLYGSTYYYFGHYYGFLVVYGLYYYFCELKRSERILYFIPMVINFIVFFQQMQSVHMVLIFLLLIALTIARRQLRYLVLIVLLWQVLLLSVDFMEPGSWIYLKVHQVTSMSKGLNVDNNSLGIRLAELYNIIDQNSYLTHLIGNGIGAYYTDSTGTLSLFDFKSGKAFPEEEVLSGRYRLIHEPIPKLYFTLGLVGLLVFGWHSVRIYQELIKNKFVLVIPIVFFVFLWSTGVQAGYVFLICSVMFASWATSVGKQSK